MNYWRESFLGGVVCYSGICDLPLFSLPPPLICHNCSLLILSVCGFSSCCRTQMGFTLASSKFRWNYADRSLCSLLLAREHVLTAITKLLFTCRTTVWIHFTSAAPILSVKLLRPCSKSFLLLTTLQSLHFTNAVTRKTKVRLRTFGWQSDVWGSVLEEHLK